MDNKKNESNKGDFDLVKEILNKGMRLTPEAIELVGAIENKKEIFESIIEGEFTIITKDDLESIIAEYEKVPEPKVEIKRSSDFEPIAKDYSPRLKFYPEKDVTNKSRCTGKPEDFILYFRNRLSATKDLFKSRISDRPLVGIKDIKKYQNETIRIIGMVIDKRSSKKDNYVIEIEDEEDSILVIATKSDEEAYKAAEQVVEDDIIMFEGRPYSSIFITKEIIWPDLPAIKEKKTIREDLAVAYISDLHLGSKFFFEKEFHKFLSWLNGNEDDKELAGKIKYLIVGGDIVDGIGIYPKQEEELVVRDIYKQYEIFSDLMEQIPDYIKIISIPGNHDAVRRAQPQPAIPEELLKGKIINLGSPSWVDIEGFKHLLYHGDSLDSIISALPTCDYFHPEIPMIELLKRRNLSPIYGKNVIVPEPKDYLMIDEVPDILHMGHIHKNGYSFYRGTHVINSGTFQDITDNQLKQGHTPTPGIVPILSLRTGDVLHKKFVS